MKKALMIIAAVVLFAIPVCAETLVGGPTITYATSLTGGQRFKRAEFALPSCAAASNYTNPAEITLTGNRNIIITGFGFNGKSEDVNIYCRKGITTWVGNRKGLFYIESKDITGDGYFRDDLNVMAHITPTARYSTFRNKSPVYIYVDNDDAENATGPIFGYITYID